MDYSKLKKVIRIRLSEACAQAVSSHKDTLRKKLFKEGYEAVKTTYHPTKPSDLLKKDDDEKKPNQ